MSNALKSIGKTFKKIVKSKVFKIVLIAAAIYFTAGIAAGAMGVAGAASMPGIGTAMSTLGIAEGSWAAAMGLSSAASTAIPAAGWVSAEGGAAFAGGLAADAAVGSAAAAGAGATAAAEAAGAAFVESSTGLMVPAAEAAGAGAAEAVSATGLVDAASLGETFAAAGETASTIGEAASTMAEAPQSVPEGYWNMRADAGNVASDVGSSAREASWGDFGSGGDVASSNIEGPLDYSYGEAGQTRWGTSVGDSTPAQPSLFDKMSSFYEKLTPGAKKILGEGLMRGGTELAKGIAGKYSQDEQLKFRREQRTVWRDPTNPYVTGNRSGLVNAASGG